MRKFWGTPSSIVLALLLLLGVEAPSAGALVVEGDMEWRVTPIQDLVLIDGTAFNNTGADIVLDNVKVPGVNRWRR